MKRKLVRGFLGVVAALALVAIGYPVAAWVGSSIPQNSDWTEPATGVDIMVETNGTHTSIIMPILSDHKDWRETFPSAARATPSGEMPTHIAIGYGEREVFLHVPTWGDLQAATALRIATIGGDSLVRVSHYVRPAPGENHRRLRISEDQYAALVRAIETALPEVPQGEYRRELRGTYADDAYYEALGDYTMINNCNSWIGARLAEAGITMGAWTPFAGGVMKWIPEPAETATSG
ncbi:DUF2459 domain-containing protein [Erythrobacter alti]|uniref:DUF2459 domain-containing protein n=1 Tax=Erythrobacter alti TaxID=1896145 RepID=UPI0030F3989A